MTETLIWISGATEGIGAGLAQTVPYPGARVINLSRRQHPALETVRFDLTDPTTYAAVHASFTKELAGFKGKCAIFIHNAYYPGRVGFVSEVDPQEYAKSIQANAAAPMILGDLFLRSVGEGYESGLVLMSSAAARHPYPGIAGYCAAKAGIEMWIRVVKRELQSRGKKTWVVAVRPGFVDTPTTRSNATQRPEDYPAADQIRVKLESGESVMTPEQAGREIWAALPPRNGESLLSFGTMVDVKK